MFHNGYSSWWQYLSVDSTKKPNINKLLLSRVWSYAQPYTTKLFIVLLSILSATLLSLLPPMLYKQLIDTTIPSKNYMELNTLAISLIGIHLASGLININQRRLTAIIGEGIIADLRQALYIHMQQMSLRFFTNTKTGEIIARLNNDVVGSQRAITGTLITLITNITKILFAVTIMISLNWQLTLLSISIVPLMIFPARKVAQTLRSLTRHSFDLNAKMNVVMNETLNVSGMLLMKLFNRQQYHQEKFISKSDAVASIGIRSAVVGRWFFFTLSTIGTLGSTAVFWYGGHLVFTGAFSIGTIIAFIAYLRELYGPLSSLANAQVDLSTSLVSFERVFEALDLPHQITEYDNPNEINLPVSTIQFDDVTFTYSLSTTLGTATHQTLSKHPRHKHSQDSSTQSHTTSNKQPGIQNEQFSLKSLQFRIHAGQLIAIVGPSGSGKTTITYLLARLYDPTEGSVKFNNIDIKTLETKTLSKLIGMVTQETYLFHSTLLENLKYANQQASNKEISDACEASNLTELIQQLPQGINTIVGERGHKLSGGEKQRVSIARVILKDPSILILDEATSSLDSKSEDYIQTALMNLYQNRTSFVIAHRLSTILAADKILVLNKGQLVEHGTHKQLLKIDGLYKELYQTQYRHNINTTNYLQSNQSSKPK